ncbi:MAG: chitobiase/beta-hexosaminidase C-terminal domain-containing protein [Butyrivibrio sp.]|jgi:tetratricopeptide (TPR) repeat protein|nr:chitobiase/beta-hexosaminidase C-terminal domain-containing protein [Butyrivibrio sp.]
MKCPNCGQEVPDGHLYCDSCGAEIKIVPEFDPELENRISKTLSDMADSINPEAGESTSEGDQKSAGTHQNIADRRQISILMRKAIRRIRKDAIVWAVVALVAVSLLICFVVTYHTANQISAQDYVDQAQSASSAGNYDQAISDLEQAYRMNEKDSAVIFLLATYRMENHQPEQAVEVLQRILNSAAFDDEEMQRAYDEMIKIYESEEAYDSIHEMLLDCPYEELVSRYSQYLPQAPSFSVKSGNYEDKLSIELQDSSDGTVYYTLEDRIPTASDSRYAKEIVLDKSGDYKIQAVLVNSYGISSDVATAEYHVTLLVPNAPQIMEKSGNYTQDTMIVAVADSGCTIFYTTDGSRPTMKSQQYVSPISMPYGDSTFRFIAYDSKGNASKITKCTYHLSYPKQVTEDQATALVISALMKQDVLLDATGKVRGLDGRNVYVVDSVIQVPDSGEYYAISEYHEYNDGHREKTNLMYAVNTQDGTVCRMSYDSSGNYFLVNMAQ